MVVVLVVVGVVVVVVVVLVVEVVLVNLFYISKWFYDFCNSSRSRTSSVLIILKWFHNFYSVIETDKNVFVFFQINYVSL